jgi:glycosyltransferase involved in cell wall biosynthesis
MGGEVSLHRTLQAINGDKFVLTATDEPYTFEGIDVQQIDASNVLDILSDPRPIAKQLTSFNAKVVIGQNELSLAAVNAAKIANAISIVSVHTPPQYGGGIKHAMLEADYAIYNTKTSAEQWGEPNALVIHPPISPLPSNTKASGDAYTVLSSLKNKGVETVLELAKMYPNKRFIIVRSPAEPTHGIHNLEERASQLPNVELHPRVSPEEVYKYLEQTRILLVPSRYETYGMSAIEAAGYGIPCVHVDTPHVYEGIGEGAILVPGLNKDATAAAIDIIEKNYEIYSLNARKRAEWLHVRQDIEFIRLAEFMDNIVKPLENKKLIRSRSVKIALRAARL